MDDDSRVPPESQIFGLGDGPLNVFPGEAEQASRDPPPRTEVEGAARVLVLLRPSVERVLRRSGVPERDIADVLQNVWMAVLPWWTARVVALSGVAPGGLPGYVAVVARRLAIQHHRASGHRAEVFEGGGPLWFDLEEREIAGLPAPPSPEERLSQAETQAETEVDFAALSRATKPARWRAFHAHVVLGVPVARIAAAERAPAPTIYTRIRRAREDLRAAITRLRAARRRR